MSRANLSSFVAREERTPLLRFLTCGSVDDGKSTLIGRLLYDAKTVMEDQLLALTKDSKKHGTTGGEIDFALLVDGLAAEREQGITIDVAYRYFATDKRTFIVADTPGHEQYTRNMATGASTSDLAVILVDARNGVVVQTRRHAYIASLLGIRHVVLAVNKMDLVDFGEETFRAIVRGWDAFRVTLGFTTSVAIPVAARSGDNVLLRSERTPWFEGPLLMEHLETVDVESAIAGRPFRMAVQWVNRPDADFRGFSGTVSSGEVSPGDVVVVARSGRSGRVRRIVTLDGDLPRAIAGEAVTLVLEEAIDVSSGDLLVAPNARPEVSDQVAAHVLWMAEEELLPGRQYLLKCGARTVMAEVSALKHKVDVTTFEHLAAKTLRLNEIGSANLALAEPLAFDPYRQDRDTGGFILIDRFTNQTVAAGMIDFGLRRAANLHPQATDVDEAARAKLKGQKPVVLWFTGLSGSGKSTIANLVEMRLSAEGRHTYLLDGDNVRRGLCRDLGFTDADRVENIRRVSEVARLFVDAGLIVLVAFISPFRSEREMARRLVGERQFVEIFVDTPLEVCAARDPKGLYRKAMAGELANFTGVDSPYEAPLAADVTLRTVGVDAELLATEVVRHVKAGGYLG